MTLVGPEFVGITEDGVYLTAPLLPSSWQSKKRAPLVATLSILVTGLIAIAVNRAILEWLFPIVDFPQIVGSMFFLSSLTVWLETDYNFSWEIGAYLILGALLFLHASILSFLTGYL